MTDSAANEATGIFFFVRRPLVIANKTLTPAAAIDVTAIHPSGPLPLITITMIRIIVTDALQAEQSDECATMAGAWPTSDAFAFPSISRLISKRI